MIAGNPVWLPVPSHRSILYWVYRNGSGCHEDMDRWAFPFRGYLANEWGGRRQSVSCGCPVLRRGGGVLD